MGNRWPLFWGHDLLWSYYYRATHNWRHRVFFHLMERVFVYIVIVIFSVPALGGLVAVFQMLLAYRNCYDYA